MKKIIQVLLLALSLSMGSLAWAQTPVVLTTETGQVSLAPNVSFWRVASGTMTFAQAQAALAGQPVPPLPPLAERWATAVRQVELSVADKGEHIAVLEARKQLCWYLKGVSHANYYKEKIVQLSTLDELHALSVSIKRDLR